MCLCWFWCAVKPLTGSVSVRGVHSPTCARLLILVVRRLKSEAAHFLSRLLGCCVTEVGGGSSPRTSAAPRLLHQVQLRQEQVKGQQDGKDPNPKLEQDPLADQTGRARTHDGSQAADGAVGSNKGRCFQTDSWAEDLSRRGRKRGVPQLLCYYDKSEQC